MPDVHFKVDSAEPAPSDGQALLLRLEAVNLCAGERVQSIALTIQLQIEPARRRYSDDEKNALADLFGEPARWGTTVRALMWTTVNTTVPAFTGATHFDLLIPCAGDSDVAAAKYLRALEEGEVPLTLLFSGRVLYLNGERVQMSPIPWTQETTCRVPVQRFKEIAAASVRRVVEMRGTG